MTITITRTWVYWYIIIAIIFINLNYLLELDEFVKNGTFRTEKYKWNAMILSALTIAVILFGLVL